MGQTLRTAIIGGAGKYYSAVSLFTIFPAVGGACLFVIITIAIFTINYFW